VFVPLLVPAAFEPDVLAFVPLEVPLVPLLDDPALLAPELDPVFVRVRSLLVLLLLGCVVGSLPVVFVFVRLRVLVPDSLLSHPMNAMPPSASAAATRIP